MDKKDDNNLPIYLRIAEKIKKAVKTGEYISGTKLLPERVLAKRLGVSRNTVRLAIEELSAEGILESKARHGTFISQEAWNNTARGTSPDWPSYLHSRFSGLVPHTTPDISARYPGEEISFIRQFFEEVGIPEKEHHKLYSSETKQPHGSLPLRHAVAAHLGRYGIKATAENVLITSSTTQATYLLVSALLEMGSNFYYESSGYINLRHILEDCGANVVRLSMDDEGLSIDRIVQQALFHKKAVLHLQPDNHHPTGITTSLKRRMEIIKSFAYKGIPVIEMNSMIDIYAETVPPPPLKALDETNAIVFVGNMARATCEDISLSWVVADEYLINMLAAVKSHQDKHVNTTAQLITELSFTSGFYDIYMERFRRFLLKRRDAYNEIMQRHIGDIAVWEPKRSSYYFWPAFDESINLKLLHRNLRHVTFTPGSSYDPDDLHHISICTLAMPPEQFDKALAHFKQEALKSCRKE